LRIGGDESIEVVLRAQVFERDRSESVASTRDNPHDPNRLTTSAGRDLVDTKSADVSPSICST
jgi:hypothetical protein